METPVNPGLLLPDDLAAAVENLAAELRSRTREFPHLEGPERERRFRKDVHFCSRMLSIYKTVADIQRRDPDAHPLDPAQLLPESVARGLADTERYLAELIADWSKRGACPTDAQFDAALTALCRIVAIRRSCWDLQRACPRPRDFPGWDSTPPSNGDDPPAANPAHQPAGSAPADPALRDSLSLCEKETSASMDIESDLHLSEQSLDDDPSEDDDHPPSDPPDPPAFNPVHPHATPKRNAPRPTLLIEQASPSPPPSLPPHGASTFRSIDPRSSLAPDQTPMPQTTNADPVDPALCVSVSLCENGNAKTPPDQREAHPEEPAQSTARRSRHRVPVSSRPNHFGLLQVTIRVLRSLRAVPESLVKRVRRDGPGFLYLRPALENPVIRKLGAVAGRLIFDFAPDLSDPPDPPPPRPPSEWDKLDWYVWRRRQGWLIPRDYFHDAFQGTNEPCPGT